MWRTRLGIFQSAAARFPGRSAKFWWPQRMGTLVPFWQVTILHCPMPAPKGFEARSPQSPGHIDLHGFVAQETQGLRAMMADRNGILWSLVTPGDFHGCIWRWIQDRSPRTGLTTAHAMIGKFMPPRNTGNGGRHNLIQIRFFSLQHGIG